MERATSLAEAATHNVPPEVFLRHYREIRDCAGAHADTGMALARAKKSAKASGIDLDAVKLLQKLTDLDTDEAAMQLRHLGIYLRWLEAPIGTQFNFFGDSDTPQPKAEARQQQKDWQAGQTGLEAGRHGEQRDQNPNKPGTSAHVAWDKAWLRGNRQWLKGQEKIAADLGANAKRGKVNGNGKAHAAPATS